MKTINKYLRLFRDLKILILTNKKKTITALALDPGGARLLTGSNDYMVRFWDFAGMNSEHRSFREVEPHSGHQVRSLSYSISGDQFLVTTGSAKPKIYSRDGHELYDDRCSLTTLHCPSYSLYNRLANRAEFVRGDMYLLDMSNTKGHVAAVSQGTHTFRYLIDKYHSSRLPSRRLSSD